MSLLALPAELRLRIYEYIPELLPNAHHNLLPTQITPPISRTCTIFRRETLPLYATDSIFAICIDDSPEPWKRRIDSWISALGPEISRIRSLQISRHWNMLQPQRWQGRVGFYIRIDHLNRECRPSKRDGHNVVLEDGGLKVTTGTYPVVRDTRNMRSASIELLARVFRERLATSSSDRPGLTGDDVRFLVRAVEIVVSYKIPHSIDVESDRERSQEILQDMENTLRVLA
ncbi:uncharacterized protein RCC_07858 [Ramularia collo-cygni]|uniref:F-box domain-containing protein n=1 Tax=Ramularia collo-cygni TaxID=112498 RepID=A0A2D3VIW3_9PEZI|nr:uncharacterized protein RCC_07858 [Ramularia collo-cygni]CZT21989.1 uncharacterized protein RCC_07858 [Ramularia collo-cygni]